MNGLKNIFAGLFAVLWLTAGQGHAETVIWSDNFDTTAASRWKAGSVWQISSPTAGPAINAAGYRTHSGTRCASTQKYTLNQDDRLICTNYNHGSNSLVVPDTSQFPRLCFWHWFNFDNALGFVEISTNAGSTWSQISPTYMNTTSGGVWSHPSIDLSAFAGQSVQIAFHFTSGSVIGNSLGWYVDDVAVVTGPAAWNNPESFESGAGDWTVDAGTWEIGKPTSGPKAAHTGTNCAATILAGNYPNNVDSRLISPFFPVSTNRPALRFWQWYNLNNALGFVEISTDGSSWTMSSLAYTNCTSVGWVNASLDLNAYAGQTIQVAFHFMSGGVYTAPGWYVDDVSVNAAPELMVPDTQTVYAGETLMVTNYATLCPTNGTAIFTLLSPKNLDNLILTTNGVLTWATDITQPTGTNTITLKVTDNNSPALSTTNSFEVVVENPWMPVLTVPPTQTIYAGQELVVTNSATNELFPDDTFTYTNISAPDGVTVDSTSGVLTWSTSTEQTAGTNTIIIVVTDDSPPYYSATNSFEVIVLNPPPPVLTMPSTQTIYAGRLFTTNISATNSAFPDGTFTYTTNPAPAGVAIEAIDSNTGELTWTPTAAQALKTYTIAIEATEDNQLSAIGSFKVIVSPLPRPALTVGTQTNYAGQTLAVTLSATNTYAPEAAFTYSLPSPTTNYWIDTNSGVLTWTNNGIKNGILTWTNNSVAPGTTNISVIVTEQTPTNYGVTLAVTNKFSLVFLPPRAPTLFPTNNQFIYVGQTLTVTNFATNSYSTNFSFSLPSPSTNYWIDTNSGVLMWTNTAALPGTNAISVKVKDSSVPPLYATNSFKVVVLPLPLSVLTVGTQTNYAGQTLAVTLSATNVYKPDSVFTYSLPSPTNNYWIDTTNGVLNWTNTGIKNGILTWTNNSVAPGTNTISVTVSNHSVPALSATNSFKMIFLPPHSPTLTVPTNQSIYVGQTLTVTNFATNSYSTNFSFSLLSPSNNVAITTNGVLTWTNTGAKPGTNTISVKVTDNSVPPLSATNSFTIQVMMPTPPDLTVAQLLAGSHSFQFSLLTLSNTTWRIDASSNLLDWQPVFTNQAGTDGTLQFTDLLATNFPQRFYRAVYP